MEEKLKIEIERGPLYKKLQEAILENLKPKPLKISSKQERIMLQKIAQIILQKIAQIIESDTLSGESFDCNVSVARDPQNRACNVSMAFRNPSPALRKIIEEENRFRQEELERNNVKNNKQ